MAAYYADPAILAHTTSLQPYGRFSDPNDANQSASVYNLPTDSEADVEIDELESDTEDDQVASASTAGQKKGGKKLGERVPGTSLLPASRIENIIHADGVTSSLSMSKEAVFMISVATEEFIKRMTQAGHRRASAARRNSINYVDMASSTQQYQEFMFLQSTIPEPITLTEALDRREAKLREDLAANPAMSSSNQAPTAPISSSHHSINGKPRGKGRVADDKDKPGSSPGRPRGDDKKGLDIGADDEMDHIIPINPSRSSSGRVIKASRAVREGMQDSNLSVGASPANGSAHYRDQEQSWPEITSPPRSLSQRPSYDFPPYAPGWPGQYTGPASGFLQDPSHAWTSMKQNPGRTIYSQQQRPEDASYR